jgi:hypothetical protein
MRFATYLKFVKKNCQRDRDKFLYYESKNLNVSEQEREAVYIVRKCLDEQLTPYGIIGSFSQLNFITQTNLNKKALKRLGKAALRKGQFLFLKDVMIWYLSNRCLTGTTKKANEDMREIPFRELDIEKYRSLKYNRRSMGLEYRTDPF